MEAQSARPDAWSGDIEAEINKRLSMNMLIQGAATHAMISGHHTVSHQLNSLSPPIQEGIPNTLAYDRYASAIYLSYWALLCSVVFGWTDRFWRRVGSGQTGFCRHPFFVRHGRALTKAARKEARERARTKGAPRLAASVSIPLYRLHRAVRDFEAQHKSALEKLAIDATVAIWEIERAKLIAELGYENEPHGLPKPESFRGALMEAIMIGWSRIHRSRDSGLVVKAKSISWILLIHELTKGVVELIGLHGLNRMPRAVYDEVIQRSDKIEYELRMIQTGLEVYRRVLAVVPGNCSVPRAMMHIARMPADQHSDFLMQVIENPELAERTLEDAEESS